MAKEIRIQHKEIADSQTITRVNERKFRELGLDIHRHEVEKIEDDHSRGERIMKIKNTKYYGPWGHRG